jgi:hypothetical protein
MAMNSAVENMRARSVTEAIAEIVLALLPIVAVFFVMLYLGKPLKLFSKPEWAFGAAIFFGQALVRILGSMIKAHKSVKAGKVILFAVVILVFGLVPTLLILAFVIIESEKNGSVLLWVQIVQIVLFGASAFSYVVVTAVADRLTKDAQAA